MLVDINKIIVKDRIRKDFGNVQELADDIKENSLLNPVTVIPAENGMYRLIAGERRLRACKLLGYTSIVVNSVSVKDAEQVLRMEISENENRKEFSFSERMDYAKRLEVIERAKAEERMKNPVETLPQGKTRDIVAAATGFGSGKNYDKAKFISENASDEIIKALDEGKLSINGAYQHLMFLKKQAEDRVNKLEQELINKDLYVSNKDLEIAELKLELKSLLDKQPQSDSAPVMVIPDDYEALKKQVDVLKQSEKNAREEASNARNESAAYKHSLETWKSGGRSFEQISLPDFKFAVRAFMRDVSPLIYMGEQFLSLKQTEKDKYLEELEVIDRWISDIKQALEGNSVGANLIILEGGK
jgi:ParB family chromosome partitioning protein